VTPEAGIAAAVLADLEAAGIAHAVLWPGDGVETDLLLEAARRSDARRIFAAHGFVQLPRWGYPHHDYHVVHRNGQWAELDVVTELRFGLDAAVRTSLAEPVLRRRDESDAFWILVLHCLLDKRGAQGRHAAALRALASRATRTGPVAEFLEPALPPGWTAARIASSVAAGEWGLVAGLRAPVERRLARAQRVGFAARTVRHRVGRRLRLQWAPQRGLAIGLRGASAERARAVIEELGAAPPFTVARRVRTAVALARLQRLRGRTVVVLLPPGASSGAGLDLVLDADADASSEAWSAFANRLRS